MGHAIYKALHRLVLLLGAAALCAMAPAAQDAKTAPNFANAPAGASIPSTTPVLKGSTKAPLTPPPGKMRGVTNRMRWEAARRTADRKSHARVKVYGQANQGEVKQ